MQLYKLFVYNFTILSCVSYIISIYVQVIIYLNQKYYCKLLNLIAILNYSYYLLNYKQNVSRVKQLNTLKSTQWLWMDKVQNYALKLHIVYFIYKTRELWMRNKNILHKCRLTQIIYLMESWMALLS